MYRLKLLISVFLGLLLLYPFVALAKDTETETEYLYRPFSLSFVPGFSTNGVDEKADLLENMKAVYIRQVDVQQDHIGVVAPCMLNTLSSCEGGENLVTLLQDHPECLLGLRIVIDKQEPDHGPLNHSWFPEGYQEVQCFIGRSIRIIRCVML